LLFAVSQVRQKTLRQKICQKRLENPQNGSLLCEKNGYTDTKIFMHDDFFRWYEAASPKCLGERITMCPPNSHRPLYMLVVSKKTGIVPDVLFAARV
jgi:hypothetical protein